MADLRPTTNLVVPSHLILPKKELNSKFMFVYRGAYPGSKMNFMTSLWASSLFPSVVSDPKFRMKTNRKGATQIQKVTPSGYLSVKKIIKGADSYFVASVPLFAFGRHNPSSVLDFLKLWMLGEHKMRVPSEPTAQALQETREFTERVLPPTEMTTIEDVKLSTAKVIQSLRLDQLAKASLEACLLGVRVQVKGNASVIFADFKISKEEAQQLTSTEWISLRDIDLYPLLLNWVHSGFGELAQVPIASFPISKIAFSLPPSHVKSARVDADSISIGPNGHPYYIPKSIDKQQTVSYEDKYTQAGAREDGSFALVDINEGAQAMDSGAEVKVRLPINMPVSIDWVNNKYAYTTTTGSLKVQDLIRFHAADVSHIRTLLDERYVSALTIDWFVKMGTAAKVATSEFRPISSDLADIATYDPSGTLAKNFDRATSMQDWWKSAVIAYGHVGDSAQIPYSELSTKGFGPFRPIARYIQRVVGAIKDNIDVVYQQYSVSTVSEMFPWMVMVAKYADNMVTVRADDAANRKAALNQEVDPKWKPPSIPLLSDNFGFLPHQKKVRNLMKDSPDFALFRVQAGGGKSPLILTDILYEIKANRNEPYLILCPGHLVANYVEEIVYFTQGKLNVLPITNYAIRQNGVPRLQAMLESMPRNSVVVVDYDTLKYRQRKVVYGTTPISVFPLIDFLRQFRFGYAALDESHKVKNDTARTRAVMALITDIQKKRLASGTMAHDSPTDLANQVAALDPTLFGTREEFNQKYGEVFQGKGPSARVIKWKPGAPKQIMDKIKTRMVDASAMRKEWAALLPPKEEWIGGVNLTPKQQEVYDLILNEVIERLEELAKTNKKIAKFVNGNRVSADQKVGEESDEDQEVKEGEEEDSEADTDEYEGEDLASLIQPYLSRLEQFLIAPGADILASKILKGADLLSPKTSLILSRIEAHIFGSEFPNPKTGKMEKYGPFPGKVLVFTNQIASAEEIFERASPRLKKCGLLYKAANKLEDGAKFAKNTNIKWMVGVEQSMNEGLNFQFASRLVRCEGVWNPGTLEQGNSRINRPELKSAELRDKIFYDWIVANQTIDITKMARLISKVIAIAKFENSESADYQNIEDVEVIKLSLPMLKKFNNWEYIDDDRPGLMTYNMAFKKYEKVRDADYRAYKDAYIVEHGSNPTREPVAVAPTPPDAKLMLRTPYTPGMALYNAAELGLVRVDAYLNVVVNDEDDDEGEGEDSDNDDEDDDTESPLAIKAAELKGRAVHTEYGEGVIFKCSLNARHVVVDLAGGQRIMCRKSACFVITRPETSTKDIRNQLLKQVGKLPLTDPIDVPAAIMKYPKRSVKVLKQQMEKTKVEKQKQVEEEQESALNVELQFTITNGFLGITYFVDEGNQTASKALQACGFRPDAPFYYARIFDSPHLRNQFKLWHEKGMQIDPQAAKNGVSNAIAELDGLLKSGRISKMADTISVATSAKMLNFYRQEHKPNNDKKMFKPYPLIEGNIAYLALPINGQSGTKEAMRFRRPRTKWMMSSDSLSFYGSIPQLVATMKKIVDVGIHVSNIEDLRAEFTKLKKMKIRTFDEVKKIIGD